MYRVACVMAVVLHRTGDARGLLTKLVAACNMHAPTAVLAVALLLRQVCALLQCTICRVPTCKQHLGVNIVCV